jgi:hypothetical protein
MGNRTCWTRRGGRRGGQRWSEAVRSRAEAVYPAHGLQIRRISTKCDRPGPNYKIGEFWNLNLIFLKKYKNT